ncbi:60S ribosomal protein L44 [Vararia minispora EC-137]|uniref:60S ribosomal protein L44 n=1 Tax=Vararia minispora EC-137 TaxID=1314806 RepID=A0ACB8QQJ8_9AGAM|nr:60S ribosomal protein L44 [Vararia minispora EC-137]
MTANQSDSENPFDELIRIADREATRIQTFYEQHCSDRNRQQRDIMMSPTFSGLATDDILKQIIDPAIDPPFIDTRNAIALWTRPPQGVRDIVDAIQQKLSVLCPRLWLMPLNRLHLSLLEIVHSTTPAIVAEYVDQLGPHLSRLLAYLQTHPTRLFRPRLACDVSSLVLKFLPVVEASSSYTYHHLRRDLFDQMVALGIRMHPRYIVPSAHVTVARFVYSSDFETDGEFDGEKMSKWWALIDEINAWLASLSDDKSSWSIDGIECRTGTQWYGGGESIEF